ncbi:MAG: Fe-S cluster assembly ATPase SufC [Firmicutes bacterium]|nr:Fe-S cluster assembly ATPase SufC [Bacillota bacterium]
MLNINKLNVKVLDKEVIKDFNLDIKNGEIHALMGPNGIGKSSICKTILGDSNYVVESGSITFNGKDLLSMDTTSRAQAGIFLLNQNPIAIEGVTNAEMLRSALNVKFDGKLNLFQFNKEMLDICKKLDIPSSFIHRNINDGMSGGERKKNELLHMWMLKPSFIILDEIDSGLDVDALKLVSESINEYYELYKPSILIITHRIELLHAIKPEYVHMMKDHTIVKSGDMSLAEEINKSGYNKANDVKED